MGIAADSLFNVLMSWVRALVNALWALFSADRTTALEFLGKNWMTIAVTIIVCGLVIDWFVWLIRWQPYRIWARKLRRLLRLDEPDEEEPKEKGKAHAAVMPEKRYARPDRTAPDEETPLYLHELDEDEASDWDDDAQEAFASYPGMHYDSASAYKNQYTKPHSALTDEEEEAEESTRRLAAVDAHQLQMQEEARARAEAEKAERERLEQEARAEQERLAKEAYEAEQARLAYEVEQARLAQEEYERQLEEYERQKAQYERDLAEYERQKAEYDAQLAAQQAYDAQQQATASASRRRRMPSQPQEETQVIPAQKPVRPVKSENRPAKPNPKTAKPKTKPAAKPHAKNAEPAAVKNSGLLGRVAKMIEPEEEEIISRKTLPPRIDMNDAFRTAKLPVVTPPKTGRRKK